MSDEQTDTLPATPPDAFAAALALIAVALDPKSTEARLRSLREHEVEAAKATAELTTERAAFEQQCASERAAIAARAEAVSKSEIELFVRKNAVAAREDAASEVENAWRYVMESDYVKSGFQSAEFGPFVKMKRWIAGLSIVSTDSDYAADAKNDTSDTDPAARRNDPAFIETMPPGVTITRSAQTPPRSASARRAMRNAAEL